LEKLKQLLGPAKKQEIKDINGLILSIKQHISTNSWEEFRTYFENVYSTFYANLDAAFPGLNQGEKKLCAMLKLGLSTKEISLLTYREIKSVESARNRLRKKMQIDPKTNLSAFLARF
jgi:DNA-binding NarL/FixJ family response regulator